MFDGTQISGMELKSGACLEQTPASGPQTQPKDTHDTSTPNNAQTSETRSDADIVARIAELQREAFSLGTAALVCALSHSTLPFFLSNNTLLHHCVWGNGCTTTQPPGMFIGVPALESALSGGATGIGLDITKLSPLFIMFLGWQRLNQVCTPTPHTQDTDSSGNMTLCCVHTL